MEVGNPFITSPLSVPLSLSGLTMTATSKIFLASSEKGSSLEEVCVGGQEGERWE